MGHMDDQEIITKLDPEKYKWPGLHPGQKRDAYGRFGMGSTDGRSKLVESITGTPLNGFIKQDMNLTKQGGTPRRDFAIAFEKVLLAKVTEEVWGKIFDKAIEQAKEGDKDARKWLTDYYVGPPIQRASVDMQVRARTVVSEEIVTSRDFIEGVASSVEDVDE